MRNIGEYLYDLTRLTYFYGWMEQWEGRLHLLLVIQSEVAVFFFFGLNFYTKRYRSWEIPRCFWKIIYSEDTLKKKHFDHRHFSRENLAQDHLKIL